MQEKSSIIVDEKLLDKIIAVAYGNAGLLDRIFIYWHAKKDQKVEQLLNEYKATARSVNRLKEAELPDSILSSVQEKTNSAPKTDLIGSFAYAFISRPLLSAGSVGIIILALVTTLLIYEPQPESSYTKAEIELAQQQLGESIAIVNKVFQMAGKKIDEEVIPNHVSKPIEYKV